jgi:gas vesicle protein
MGKFRSFLFGSAVGALAALLFAPRTGEETRALVAEKADEYWGKGQALYGQGKTRVQDSVASVQPILNQKGDELREKIDNARTLIAEQVAKNAATAREVINDKVPGAADKISQAADVVRGRIDTAATKLKGRATTSASTDGVDTVTEAVSAATADESADRGSASDASTSTDA